MIACGDSFILSQRIVSSWSLDIHTGVWTQIETEEESAAELDKTETAAWYGRGEKPEHEPLDWVRFELAETSKPAKPGLLVVQGEGRYQGLGFNGES